ncbi:MAG: adenylosuccinate lyase [Phycisphaerales bacterium]
MVVQFAMTSPYDTYTSPLATRNARPEMLRLWSARHKFNTWRRIWLAAAEAQHELGLPVTGEQVEELRAVVERPGGITDAEIRAAEKYERELRHDVMAHVHALGDSCPKARGIIHLGMTSQDVVCNADLLVIYASIDLTVTKLARAVIALSDRARALPPIPALGFTHYQPAQPVTVARRLGCWAADIAAATRHLTLSTDRRRYRGLRGATGTQAAMLELCDGDHARVDAVEEAFLLRIAPPSARWERTARDGKTEFIPVAAPTFELSGQTYPRVFDAIVLSNLAGAAAVLHKVATDIRLLANRKELDEPFEDRQIGSSAMPYKRNPMRCERICGLTRFVMNLVGNAYDTAATQWLERTLDDSSNRRLSLPEAFLALDGALELMHNVASGLIVHEAMVRKNLMAELPFMATENILMACVKLGGDRQHYHELIRVHAQAAGTRVKQEGLDNDLLDRLKADKNFQSKTRGGTLSAELDWEGVMDPMKYIGRSVGQTERFINEVVEPLRERYGHEIAALDASGPKV